MGIRLVTVIGESPDVLPHMLRYYRSIGIQEFIVHAHSTSRDTDELERISKIAADFDIKISSINVGPWFPTSNLLLHTLSRAEHPDDWFIVADQDEFQVFPEDLADIIRFCDRKRYDFIEGCLIDRISDSGHLASVISEYAIWEQFPIGCLISARVLGSVTNKIAVLRGFVRVGIGQHYAHSGTGCPTSDIYVPVHHFKWVNNLVRRLRSRAEFLKVLQGSSAYNGSPYLSECLRFLSYYDSRGRIEIEDPRVLAARCDLQYPYTYPHWKSIMEWRSTARYFSPELAKREIF